VSNSAIAVSVSIKPRHACFRSMWVCRWTSRGARQRLGFEVSVLGAHVIDGRTDGSQTLCWRGVDSNFRFRNALSHRQQRGPGRGRLIWQ
jgi:hypothetical protein